MRRLTAYIGAAGQGEGIPLPSGGMLTVERFLCLGLAFGCYGAFDLVHSVILRLVSDLDRCRRFTSGSLAAFETAIPSFSHPAHARFPGLRCNLSSAPSFGLAIYSGLEDGPDGGPSF